MVVIIAEYIQILVNNNIFALYFEVNIFMYIYIYLLMHTHTYTRINDVRL